MTFVLPQVAPAEAGFRVEQIDRVCNIVETHIAESRYPGAQVALARHGKLAFFKTFGAARLAPQTPARDDTLWLMYSNTKVITAAAVWILVEEGALTFHDRISDHVPEFACHGKRDLTLLQVLTHQGGFPSAGYTLPREAWQDHKLLRKLVCDFTLEWTPGSRVHYHGVAAHWTAAVLIEAVTKGDYRDFIRKRVIEPLGI